MIPGNSVETIFSASFGSTSDLGIWTLKGTIRNLLKYPFDLSLVLGSSFRQKSIFGSIIIHIQNTQELIYRESLGYIG